MTLPYGRHLTTPVRYARVMGVTGSESNLAIALGALFWYRAYVGVTGSPVTQWSDLSGNAYHLTDPPAPSVADGPTVVSNQLGGRQVIRFNGTSNRLQTPTLTFEVAKRYTLFVLSKQSGLGVDGRQLWGAEGANGGINSFIQDSDEYFMYDGVFNRVLEAHAESSFELKVVRRNADAQTVIRRGKADTGTRAHLDYTNPSNIPYHIGGQANDAFFWSGDIAEVIGFASSLSDENVISLENDIYARWGL